MGALKRDVFQGLADPTRRNILMLIKDEPKNLNAIAENFEISRPAVSQHMKVLTECGLVVIKKEGRERYCEPNLEKLNEVVDWLEPFKKIWANRFNQLDDLLNQMKKTSNEK